jgi:hypothetical protein
MTELSYGLCIEKGARRVSGLVNLLFEQVYFLIDSEWILMNKRDFIRQIELEEMAGQDGKATFYPCFRIKLRYYVDIDCGINCNYDGFYYVDKNEDLIGEIERIYAWFGDYYDDYLTRIDGFVVGIVDKYQTMLNFDVVKNYIYGERVISIKTRDIDRMMRLKRQLIRDKRLITDCENEQIDIC